MKKKILLACLVALMSTTPVYSYTGECKGGTIITANDGKTTFCKSNVEMNWWSAQAWCQVNGSQLATMYEICPSWDGNTGSDKCPELKNQGKGRIWSSTASGKEYVFYLNLPDAYTATSSNPTFTRNHPKSAFCR